MMVLCIDAGNTRVKWGLREGGQWLNQGALTSAEVGELKAAVSASPSRVVACNVAGEAAGRAIESLAASLNAPLSWVRAQANQCGVTNRYDNPGQLGADRWAALIGARALHGGACLVVNAGTATTIDVLDAEGVFQGGLILPGLDLMRSALARNTAGLPVAQGSFKELPRNTDDAIVSGAIDATVGAIERMFKRVADVPRTICLVSGGAAPTLEMALTLPMLSVGNLVLEGLARIAERE